MMAYTERLRPIGFFFFRLQVDDGVEISLVEVFKRVGPKGLTDKFYGFIKSRKRSMFVFNS